MDEKQERKFVKSLRAMLGKKSDDKTKFNGLITRSGKILTESHTMMIHVPKPLRDIARHHFRFEKSTMKIPKFKGKWTYGIYDAQLIKQAVDVMESTGKRFILIKLNKSENHPIEIRSFDSDYSQDDNLKDAPFVLLAPVIPENDIQSQCRKLCKIKVKNEH